jgi:hypothetical protein
MSLPDGSATIGTAPLPVGKLGAWMRMGPCHPPKGCPAKPVLASRNRQVRSCGGGGSQITESGA